MSTWTVILSIGAGTYLFRASMFVMLGGRELPRWTQQPMALVAPAAIASLVASLLFTNHGEVSIAPLPELAACLAGFVAVRRTGNVMHAFVVGLPLLWLLSALGA